MCFLSFLSYLTLSVLAAKDKSLTLYQDDFKHNISTNKDPSLIMMLQMSPREVKVSLASGLCFPS